jgi:hypothetical protein
MGRVAIKRAIKRAITRAIKGGSLSAGLTPEA